MPTPRDMIAKYAAQTEMSAFFIDNMGIISAKSYGALGDGVTNDTLALQGAVNAAITSKIGMVWLPVGTYLNSGLTGTTDIQFYSHSTATIFTGSTYPILNWSHVLTDESTSIAAWTTTIPALTTTVAGLSTDVSKLQSDMAILNANYNEVLTWAGV